MSLSCLRCLCISGHVTLIFVFVCFIHPSCGVTLKHAGRDESVMSALSLNFRSCHALFLFVCAIFVHNNDNDSTKKPTQQTNKHAIKHAHHAL
jgi:FtsH-binding integral membrane protein